MLYKVLSTILQHEALRVPVTALAFDEEYLFSAQGPFLKIHSKSDAALLHVCRVFDSQAIHGIVPSRHGGVLIVWGGRSISIYHFEPNGDSPILHHRTILTAQDWVLDISLSPYTAVTSDHSRPSAAVLTAHNALLLLELGPADGTELTLVHLTSTSRCILYSANLYWLDPSHILVASGTVFGEIIVWSCDIAVKTAANSVLHQLLTGHDGSIFGVRFLEAPLDGVQSRPPQLLASCSDDRTVRIWDLAELAHTPLSSGSADDFSSARESGFGCNIADALPDQATDAHCIAKAWGHASRIWDARFLPSAKDDDLTYFASVGEDATLQLWSLAPPSTTVSSATFIRALTHLGKTRPHSGKNIWASATTETKDDGIVVATGGADGSIVLNSYSRPFRSVSDSIQSWSIEAFASISEVKNSKKPDKLRAYALFNQNTLIVSTDSGNIYLLDPLPDDSPPPGSAAACRWVSHEPKLQGYSVVTSLSSLSIAFLAGLDGTILTFELDSSSDIRPLTTGPGKTAALLAKALALPGISDKQYASLLVTNVESKTALLLQLSKPADVASGRFETSAQWTVKLPDKFIVTSFVVVPIMDGEENVCSLILGSRNGSVCAFDIPRYDGVDLQPAVSCNTVFEGVHGKDAITELSFLDDNQSSGLAGHLLSVGRDGSFVVLEVTTRSSVTTFHLVNRTTLALGTVLEGLQISEIDKSVSCWGFYSKQFIVVDLLDEREIMTVDCGGANRPWKFEPSPTPSGGTFAWTKASQLCLTAQTRPPPRIIGGGNHGREIKALAVCPSLSSSRLYNAQLFATGSEDTNIKLFAYQKDKTAFRCLRTLRKHNTGIQNLQWSSDGQFLFSSGGFEEFFVWKVQPAPLIGVGVVCESICPTESTLPDLRIMSFSARQLPPTESTLNAPGFVISMVRSDSTLRVYSYTSSLIREGEWRLLSTGNYLTSCLTQCLDIESDNGKALLTAGTDGHVAIWPVDTLDNGVGVSKDVGSQDGTDPVPLRWTSRHKIQQSTIHCLLVHWINEHRDCLLLTGGDDNALAVTRLTWEESGSSVPKVNWLRLFDLTEC